MSAAPEKAYDRSALEKVMDARSPEHRFILEISTAGDVDDGNRLLFVYDQETWKQDQLSTNRFVDLVDFFTRGSITGAYEKKLSRHGNTLVPLSFEVSEDVKHLPQTIAMFPNYKGHDGLRKACVDAMMGRSASLVGTGFEARSEQQRQREAAVEAQLSKDLGRPAELQVLVIWGKAYVSACRSKICNPFADAFSSSRRSSGFSGARYVVYADGAHQVYPKSSGLAEALAGDADHMPLLRDWLDEEEEDEEDRAADEALLKQARERAAARQKLEQGCLDAVHDHLESMRSKVEQAAETMAKALGTPWLRVDVLLTPEAPEGMVVRRIRTNSPNAMALDQEMQERAAEVLAQGYRDREKVLQKAKQSKEKQAKDKKLASAASASSPSEVRTVPSTDLLAGIGCFERSLHPLDFMAEKKLRCQGAEAVVKNPVQEVPQLPSPQDVPKTPQEQQQ